MGVAKLGYARDLLLEAETPADFMALFQNEAWRTYFITTPEPHFAEMGSYFDARQHIQFANQKPGDVLATYQASLIQKAQALGLTHVVTQLQNIHYSEELLAKMPEQVAPLGAVQGELEMEVHVEQEEESEQEQELELETQNEQIKTEQRPLGHYPVRLYNEYRDTNTLLHQVTPFHGVKAKIHPAYHPTLHVTETFLPFSREGTNHLHRRRHFDENMYRIGEVRFDIQTHSKHIWDAINHTVNTEKTYTIDQIVIDDPLEDYSVKKHNAVIYDIRTNRVIQDNNYVKMDLFPEFIARVAEIKFLDGRLSGYSEGEIAALEEWLRQNNPSEMKNHLLNEILRYRYQDKQLFVGSQLYQLFERLAGETV